MKKSKVKAVPAFHHCSIYCKKGVVRSGGLCVLSRECPFGTSLGNQRGGKLNGRKQ
jgi:hypothetical protein